MLDAWKQKWHKKRWVLVASEGFIWAFQIINKGAGQLIVQKQFNEALKLDEPNSASLLVAMLPSHAKMVVSLPSKLVQIRSVQTDSRLSNTESRAYLEFQVHRNDGEDSVFTSERLLPATDEKTNQLVLSAKRSQLALFEQLVNRYRYSCLRLETAQATLAWCAAAHTPRLTSHLWGVIDLEGNALSFLVFRQQQVLCQKSFYLDTQLDNESILTEAILQKVKLVTGLLKLKESTALFCTPLFYNRILPEHGKVACSFHPLPDFELEYADDCGTAEKQVSYLASALAYKSYKLD